MTLRVFAYGSILWRPGFPFVSRKVGHVRGFERRLDQGSPDHRGTPERLGRVATLVRAPGARTGGLVYEVEAELSAEVLRALDEREQGGYERVEVEVELASGGAPLRALTYVAFPGNGYYRGPASPRAMALEIAAAVGPSGPNVEYALRLAETLRALELRDPHVEALERELLHLAAERAPGESLAPG